MKEGSFKECAGIKLCILDGTIAKLIWERIPSERSDEPYVYQLSKGNVILSGGFIMGNEAYIPLYPLNKDEREYVFRVKSSSSKRWEREIKFSI